MGDKDDDLNLVAYIAGYANVAKLNGANVFPPACSQIQQGPSKLEFRDGKLHILQDSTAVLDYRGKPQLPPTTGSFLTFGFTPTTAAMEMTQIPPGLAADGEPARNIHSDNTVIDPWRGTWWVPPS
ncbi:hypothetical protein NKH18_44420 [Streptomyces sp. M10(2022)]